MDARIVRRARMLVIGLEARVRGPEGEDELWRVFNREAVALRTPNARAPLAILAIRFAVDGEGYGFLLGVQVSSLAEIPEGLVGREWPAADYAVLSSCRGPVRDVRREIWDRAAALATIEGKARSFANDFEVHDQRSANPNKASFDLYLSLK